ncbi:MAG: hypothetical protein NTZ33_07650 [Bacteroidetes bacterium]|nr:hypothetical protein [Bacteroidota bacterium]
MSKISKFKYKSSSIFGSDKYKYGDLFGISYFPKIKELFGSDSLEVRIESFPNFNKINLCLVHDSYLGTAFLKSKNQILGIDTIYDIEYPWWRNKQSPTIQLDTSKTNIIVFEIVERSLEKLDSAIALNLVKFENVNIEQINTSKISCLKKTQQILFNKNVNTNLEFVLLDTRIFTTFKELRSNINYSFFNKTNSDVFISENSEYLFHSTTKSSLQNNITDNKVSKTVNLLNKVYEFYKNNGFDEVYFSIIPNPVSVIKPECKNYNNLIPLIQTNKNLKMQMIDIYSILKQTNYNVYYHSDTHWNKNGFQLWTNELVRKLNEKNR